MAPPPTEEGGTSRAVGSDGPAPATGRQCCASASTYNGRGYVVVPDVLGPEWLAAAVSEATAICRGPRGDIEGAMPADERDDDASVQSRYLCIHFPHKISALMRDLARHPAVVDALVDIIGPNVKLVQSILFIKAAGKPGQAWHQDESHIPTRDRSLTAVWLALHDATVDNGCLWVIPGSHRRGVLYPTRDQADARFDGRGCDVERRASSLAASTSVSWVMPAARRAAGNGPACGWLRLRSPQ
ncbi:MAG: phytanoyl-CoA dioxygenase family protein [Acidimicrobiales bacterium]